MYHPIVYRMIPEASRCTRATYSTCSPGSRNLPSAGCSFLIKPEVFFAIALLLLPLQSRPSTSCRSSSVPFLTISGITFSWTIASFGNIWGGLSWAHILSRNATASARSPRRGSYHGNLSTWIPMLARLS